MDAYVKNERIVKIKGSLETHNAGTLCVKGAAGLQYVYHPDRLTTPLIRTGDRGEGRFEPASWEDALNLVSNRLNEIKAETGPESVIFYAGYPKWMRPFLKRLAHGLKIIADVNTLIDPDYRDPISGFPAFRSLLCEVKKAPDMLKSLA